MSIDEPAPNTINIKHTKEESDKIKFYDDRMTALTVLGTHVLNAMRQNTLANPFKRSAIYGLFRRVIEMLDSASLQIMAGSVIPCMNNFRTMLEAVFQLEHLLADSTPSIVLEKSIHLQLAELHNHLVYLEEAMLDPDPEVNKSELQQLIEGLTNEIDHAHFDPVRDAYLNSVAFKQSDGKRQTFKWYALSLPRGNSFKSLAMALNKLDYYNYYYGPASNLTHSSTLHMDSFYYQDDVTYVTRIRSLEHLDTTATAIIRLTLEAFKLVNRELLYKDRAAYLLAMQELKRTYNLKTP